MKRIRTKDDVRQLGTILSVWAHPDDESFFAAGIMSAAIENRQNVICITATRGEAGIQDEKRWPAEKLAGIRENELKKCLEVIGIAHHYFMGYPDGKCCDCSVNQAAEFLREIIKEHQPDSVLTFGPDGITGHKDHQTVSKWVGAATAGTNITVYHTVEEEDSYNNFLAAADKKFNIYFNIDKPPVRSVEKCDIAFILDDAQINKKINSLRVMPSQTEKIFKEVGEQFFKNAFRVECFVKSN